MYIDFVPNRGSKPAILLRESIREGTRIRKRTIANLSALTLEQAEAIRLVLKSEKLGPADKSQIKFYREANSRAGGFDGCGRFGCLERDGVFEAGRGGNIPFGGARDFSAAMLAGANDLIAIFSKNGASSPRRFACSVSRPAKRPAMRHITISFNPSMPMR